MILLGGGCRQVGKVKAGLGLGALQQCGGFLLGLQEMREYWDGSHGGELGGQLGDAAAGHGQWWVAEGPLVEVNGVQCAEAVNTVEGICWQLEASGAL